MRTSGSAARPSFHPTSICRTCSMGRFCDARIRMPRSGTSTRAQRPRCPGSGRSSAAPRRKPIWCGKRTLRGKCAYSTLTAATRVRRWRRSPPKHLTKPGTPSTPSGSTTRCCRSWPTSAGRCKPGPRPFIRRAIYPRRTPTSAAMWPRVLLLPMWCWKRLTAPSASCTLPSSLTAAWPTGRGTL